MENEQVEETLCIPLELPVVFVTVEVFVEIEKLLPMSVSFRAAELIKGFLNNLLVLTHAVIQVLLQLNRNQFEVMVFLSAVLEVRHQSHEERLIKSLVGLVLLYIESGLRCCLIFRLALGVLCSWLVGLLENNYGLKLPMQRPKHLLEAVYEFVVDEVLQLAEHLDSAFALCEQVESGGCVFGLGRGGF